MRTRASALASSVWGRWRFISSPSKSALYGVHTHSLNRNVRWGLTLACVFDKNQTGESHKMILKQRKTPWTKGISFYIILRPILRTFIYNSRVVDNWGYYRRTGALQKCTKHFFSLFFLWLFFFKYSSCSPGESSYFNPYNGPQHCNILEVRRVNKWYVKNWRQKNKTIFQQERHVFQEKARQGLSSNLQSTKTTYNVSHDAEFVQGRLPVEEDNVAIY